MANTQAGLFLIFILDGILIGFLFDFFRILRKSFSTGHILTALEDIIFWILAGFIILYSIFAYNNGIIRGYMFLGVFCGILLYILTISKFFIKINVTIINFIKRFIGFILKPLQWIFNITKTIIFKPISNFFIKAIKILKKYIIKALNILKFNRKIKNSDYKEGFYSKM